MPLKVLFTAVLHIGCNFAVVDGRLLERRSALVEGSTSVESQPYLRTEYDHCVFKEFASRPKSAQTGVARTCYVDCLKSKATYAPRMCYRQCVNSLAKRGMDSAPICASICPAAANALWMIDTFCPPAPPTAAPEPIDIFHEVAVEPTGQPMVSAPAPGFAGSIAPSPAGPPALPEAVASQRSNDMMEPIPPAPYLTEQTLEGRLVSELPGGHIVESELRPWIAYYR